MRLLKSLFISLVILAGMIMLAAGLVYWVTVVFFDDFIAGVLTAIAMILISLWAFVYGECED